MTLRSLPTWLVVVLAAAAGGFGGEYVAHLWQNWDWRVDYRRRALQSERNASDSARRVNQPEQWRADSLRDAAARLRRSGGPTEVRRSQIESHCVVDFTFRDPAVPAPSLFSAEARGRDFDGRVAAVGYAYKPSGFGPSDTAHVVLPNVSCGNILISGWTSGAVTPPPMRLDVR